MSLESYGNEFFVENFDFRERYCWGEHAVFRLLGRSHYAQKIHDENIFEFKRIKKIVGSRLSKNTRAQNSGTFNWIPISKLRLSIRTV